MKENNLEENLIELLALALTYVAHDPDCETQVVHSSVCTCGLAAVEQEAVRALELV